tara:strand:+ start:1112 stop:1426 length:315 start_codon:yes stop_codon:yes gene_type:complete
MDDEISSLEKAMEKELGMMDELINKLENRIGVLEDAIRDIDEQNSNQQNDLDLLFKENEDLTNKIWEANELVDNVKKIEETLRINGIKEWSIGFKPIIEVMKDD